MKIYKEGHAEIAEYRGKKYRRLPYSKRKKSRNYFMRSGAGTLKEYLHRAVYTDTFGEIPEGCCIHHKDFNPLNNESSNLMCLMVSEHHSLHSKKYCEGNKEHIKANLDRIRPLTKQWQQSKEGAKHYINMGKMSAKKRVPKKFICVFCGKTSSSKSPNGGKFCSPKCNSAWRKASGECLVEKTCPVCKKEYMVNKYRKTKTCSNSCGQRLRYVHKEVTK